MPELGVVIPFYNEERTAGPVARRLIDALKAARLDFEVALVADGSTDGTLAALQAAAAGDPRVHVVCGPRAEGYGAAILKGFTLLTGHVVGWMDGDGQVPPETVVRLFEAMRREGAALGVGERQARQDGWLRSFASRSYNRLMRRVLGFRFHDINAKPKLIDRDLLRAVGPSATDWFIDTEIVAGALRGGAKIVREPVPFLAREHGASKVKMSIVLEYVSNLRAFRRRLHAQPSVVPAPVAAASFGAPASSDES